MLRPIKIGYSHIGGIYIGKEFETATHRHYATTLAISLSGSFEFIHNEQHQTCTNIIAQYNTQRQFLNPNHAQVAFIHIEPFCTQGIKLVTKHKNSHVLTPGQESNIKNILQQWYQNPVNDETQTYHTILQIIEEVALQNTLQTIDPRIQQAINHIHQTNQYALTRLAANANLSPSRFSHLFKAQTQISFREYVLYQKLVKSLRAIHQNNNLTQSSYLGGFADQAHFTRTYYKTFGILPSLTVK